MDEPFSALDVLTAENLRTELMALWAGENFPTKAICLVTHNIEEAVLLADRVDRVGRQPRPHPRRGSASTSSGPATAASTAFAGLVDKLYGLLTGAEPGVPEPEPPRPHRRLGRCPRRRSAAWPVSSRSSTRKADSADMPDIANELNFEIDDLLPLVDAAALLDLLYVGSGDLELTSVGTEFTTADIQTSKQIFAAQARTAPRWSARSVRHLARAPTAACARGSSSTCSAADSGPTTPSNNSTPPSTGAATASCSTNDTDTDQITADPAAGVFAPATV